MIRIVLYLNKQMMIYKKKVIKIADKKRNCRSLRKAPKKKGKDHTLCKEVETIPKLSSNPASSNSISDG
jgi:hypothetical protein